MFFYAPDHAGFVWLVVSLSMMLAFDGLSVCWDGSTALLESLILAQDERWRRA